MDNNDDDRRNLYEEFLSEVVRAGNPEAFFDENDLVEIFDYSSDMSNYIAKMEVLLYGARHYPDSQALATRRAWFYSSLGENEAAAHLNSRVSNGGVLNELLDLYSATPLGSPDTVKRLEEIVDRTDDFADEEIIQLVDFCAEAQLLDWVERNYDRIKGKCSYPQTFIYEYANSLEDAGDRERPVQLFEELTMLEPFTTDFWERLSEAQYRAEQYDAAISSADYALAIDPDSVPARRVKAMAMYALQRSPEEIITLLREIFDAPDITETEVGVLTGLLAVTGSTDEAVARLHTYLTLHTPTRSILDMLLSLDPEGVTDYVRRISAPDSFPTFSLLDWARDEYLGDNRALCGPLAQVMHQLRPEPTDEEASFMVEAFCLNSMHEKAVEVAESVSPMTRPELLTRPAFAYSYIMSLIRLGRDDQARDVARRALEMIKAQTTPGENIATDRLQVMTPVTGLIAERGLQLFLLHLLDNAPDSGDSRSGFGAL